MVRYFIIMTILSILDLKKFVILRLFASFDFCCIKTENV